MIAFIIDRSASYFLDLSNNRLAFKISSQMFQELSERLRISSKTPNTLHLPSDVMKKSSRLLHLRGWKQQTFDVYAWKFKLNKDTEHSIVDKCNIMSHYVMSTIWGRSSCLCMIIIIANLETSKIGRNLKPQQCSRGRTAEDFEIQGLFPAFKWLLKNEYHKILSKIRPHFPDK